MNHSFKKTSKRTIKFPIWRNSNHVWYYFFPFFIQTTNGIAASKYKYTKNTIQYNTVNIYFKKPRQQHTFCVFLGSLVFWVWCWGLDKPGVFVRWSLLWYISLLGTRVQTPSDRAVCFIPFSSMNYRQRPVLLNLSRLLPCFQPRLRASAFNLKTSPGDHHQAERFTTSVIWFVFPVYKDGHQCVI